MSIARFAAGATLLAELEAHVPHAEARERIVRAAERLVQEAVDASAAPAAPPAPAAQAANAPLAPDAAEDPLQYHGVELQLLHPRGKYTMSVFTKSILLTGPKGEQLRIPASAVQLVTVAGGMPGDTKGKILFMIPVGAAGLMVGKQQLQTVVIQTTQTSKLSAAPAAGVAGGEALTGADAVVVLCKLLGKIGVTTFVVPDPDVFKASKGHTAIAANHKVSQGFLFPLQGVLCFGERPALVLQHASIEWVELQRVDRPTTTFDLVVHMAPGSGAPRQVEFSQLDRQELASLRAYLAKSNLKTSLEVGKSADGSCSVAARAVGPGKAGAAPDDDDDDDDDEEDSDFDPGRGEEEEGEEEQGGGGGGAGKRKRKAQPGAAGSSRAHAAAAEEEEEDEDEDDDDDDDDFEASDEEDGSDAPEIVEEDPLDAGDILPTTSKRARRGR